jgi:hypothetical protein
MRLACVLRLWARLKEREDIWAEDGVQEEVSAKPVEALNYNTFLPHK